MRLIFMLLGLLTTIMCTAQSRRFDTPIVLPEVHPDQSVTYKYRAPDAKAVLLDALYPKALNRIIYM